MKTAGWTFFAIGCIIAIILENLIYHEIKILYFNNSSHETNGATLTVTNLAVIPQWYLKIRQVTIDPRRPNDAQSPFRLEAIVNGSILSFLDIENPDQFYYAASQYGGEEAALETGNSKYRIYFRGFVIRGGDYSLPINLINNTPFIYETTRLPIEDQIATLEVIGTNYPRTTVTIHYDIITH